MRRPRREAQQTRHWRLLRLLESRRAGLTVGELERELGVSYRTIYRDLRAMEDAGLALFQDERGPDLVWRIEGARPATPFAPTELIGIALAGELVGGLFEGTLFHEAVSQGLAKVRAALPERGAALFEQLHRVFRVTPSAPRRTAPPAEHTETIQRAALERRGVRIVYRSSQGERTRRAIDPYQLWFREDRIYVVAYCHLRGDVRTFALGRIEAVEPEDRSFEIRREYDPADYGGGFGVLRGTPQEVRVRFERSVATVVAERTWAPGQRIEWTEDGRLELTLAVESLAEFRHWVLGFGPKAEVLAPRALRREMREKLSAMLARYEKDA